MIVDRNEHVFCKACGSEMREKVDRRTLYDRKTGEPREHGPVYWSCPQYDKWKSSRLEDDANPHDRVYLRTL